MPANRKYQLSRYWWTRERLLTGLRRLHQETGQAPAGLPAYGQLVRLTDCGRREAQRRYPSQHAILRQWPSLVEAWRAAGIEVSRSRMEVRPARREGERHGRLVVLEFVGYRERKRDRVELWRCRCDCGGERIVEGSRLKWKRECERCARETLLTSTRRAAQARWHAVRASALHSSRQEQV